MISSQIKGTCSKQLFKKQNQKDSRSFWSGESPVKKSQNHLQPLATKLHLSASSRLENSDEYLKSISSPKRKPSATSSSSSGIFTSKSLSGIIEEDVIIEGQSSYEVIDVDNYETAADKRRKNTRMKQRQGSKSEPSIVRERGRNISVRLPSLLDETNDVSDSWTKESLPKSSIVSSSKFKLSAPMEMISWDSEDSNESLPDLVVPDPSTRSSNVALGKARVDSVNFGSVGTNSNFEVTLKAVEMSGFNDHVTEDKINTIKAILPNTITRLIMNTLMQCRGDVQASVSMLLDRMNDIS